MQRIFLRLTQQKTKIHLQNEVYFNRVRVVSCKLPDFRNSRDSITINLGQMMDTNSDLTTIANTSSSSLSCQDRQRLTGSTTTTAIPSSSTT